MDVKGSSELLKVYEPLEALDQINMVPLNSKRLFLMSFGFEYSGQTNTTPLVFVVP